MRHVAVVVVGLCMCVVAANAAAQTEPNVGVIVINPSSDDTSGAKVRLDGKPAGTVPFRKTVVPGRHLVQVGKRGFETFSKWVDVVAGEVLTIPVLLVSKETKSGSLLVNADVTGIPVFVDGQQRGGTPLVVDGLTPGEHLIEIRSPGEGYRPFSKVVEITEGQRTTVEASLRIAPELGSLRVITNVPGAMISLDGSDIGVAPAARAGLKSGEHIVRATIAGYEPVEQSVTVIAGRERVVSLRFTTPTTEDARIWIRSNLPDATITIDGEDFGTPPIMLQPATPGTHTIIVKAPGHREFRRTCTVGEGRNCEVFAQLYPLGVPIRVEANVADARLFVDGEPRGPVPWEGDLAAGEHEVEVRAEGYQSHIEQISLQKSQRVRLLQVVLTRQADVDLEARRKADQNKQESYKQAVSHSAAPLPVGLTVLDMSGGWPYLAELGLATGINEFIAAGVSVRTFGRLTDFEIHTKGGWRASKQFSLGSVFRLGGGVGPQQDDNLGNRHKTNDFFLALEGLATLHFPSAGAFTIWMAMDFNSDRWDFAGNNSDIVVSNERQNSVRGRLGGSLEITLSRRWNVWFIFEGIVAGDRRRVLGDIFGGGRDDTKIYGRLGATYKFGGSEEGR